MGDPTPTYGSWHPRRRGTPRGLYKPFPDIYRTTVEWASDAWTKWTMASGDGLTFGSLRTNSIFDPDWAFGGESVRGYEELSSIYHRYIVTSAWIELTVVTEGTVQDQLNYMWMANVAHGEMIPGKNLPLSRVRFFWPNMKYKAIAPMGQGGTVYKNKMTIKWTPTYNWPARNFYEDPSNWGDLQVGSNPSNQNMTYFGVARDIPDTDTTAALDYRFKIRMFQNIVVARYALKIPSSDADSWIPASVWELTAGYGEADDDGAPTENTYTDTATGTTADMPSWYVDN